MNTDEKLPTIASLWIGPALSWLEQLCLSSFRDLGHRVILYSYQPVAGIPKGIEVADAAKILPGYQIIRHARTGSPAYHADLFRLHLLRLTDHVWVDTDAYCCRPLEMPTHGHIHGYIGPRGESLVNNGVLHLPKDSATLAEMLAFTASEYPVPPWLPKAEQDALRQTPVHVSEQPWGVWGPTALSYFLNQTGEDIHSADQEILYPVPFQDKGKFFRTGRYNFIERMVTARTVSIHLWGRRFRSVAASMAGIPPKGSYAAMLLKRHGIDPQETAHLMSPVGKAQDVDLSAFGEDDLVNLCLQRSNILDSSAPVKAWIDGDAGPLLDFVADKGVALAERVYAEMEADFAAMDPALRGNPPERVADIGAGYGFIDLMLYRAFDCDIVLIDIEDTKARHFGFQTEGAGYSCLTTARQFLEANGVPANRITTINPTKRPQAQIGQVDLAVSLISCGYHYPADTYDWLYRENLRKDGALILDIRTGSRGIRYLKTLGDVSILTKGNKRAMTHVQMTPHA